MTTGIVFSRCSVLPGEIVFRIRLSKFLGYVTVLFSSVLDSDPDSMALWIRIQGIRKRRKENVPVLIFLIL
jgi:hypothetical protein